MSLAFFTTEQIERGLWQARCVLAQMKADGVVSDDTGFFIVLDSSKPYARHTDDTGWTQGWNAALLYRGMPGGNYPLSQHVTQRLMEFAVRSAAFAWRLRMDTLGVVSGHPELLEEGDTLQDGGGVYQPPLVVGFAHPDDDSLVNHTIARHAATGIMFFAARHAQNGVGRLS